MMGRSWLSLLLIVGLLAGVGGCSKDDSDPAKIVRGIEPSAPNAGVIEFIRNGHLRNFPGTTIGAAFDAYKHLVYKEWKAVLQPGATYSVDFVGWLRQDRLKDDDRRRGIANKGLAVTFVINADGSYYVFMASKLESSSGGSMTREEIGDIAGVLTAIYANRMISL